MFRSLGYTLIELVIVLAIIAGISVLSVYGLASQNSKQLVTNAQLEFVSNLRSVINGVDQGINGQNFEYLLLTNGTNSYALNSSSGTTTRTFSMLQSKVYLCIVDPPSSQNIAICAANPNLSSYPNGATCSSCASGSYFACQSTGAGYAPIGNAGPDTITVRFSQNSNCLAAGNVYHKDVVIEGSGMQISRVNPL